MPAGRTPVSPPARLAPDVDGASSARRGRLAAAHCRECIWVIWRLTVYVAISLVAMTSASQNRKVSELRWLLIGGWSSYSGGDLAGTTSAGVWRSDR